MKWNPGDSEHKISRFSCPATIRAGIELLVRYNNKPVWDSITGIEPVLRIGNVEQEIENQGYRFRREHLKFRPPVAGAAPAEMQSPAGSSK